MILEKQDESQNNESYLIYLFKLRTIRKVKGEGRVGRFEGVWKVQFSRIILPPGSSTCITIFETIKSIALINS